MLTLYQSTAPIGAFPEKTFRLIERKIIMYNLKQTGECVKALRKSLTQEELANKIHISVDTIRKIEQGKKGMSIDLLIEIADYFDVSTDYLLCRSKGAGDYKQFLIRFKSELDNFVEHELNM